MHPVSFLRGALFGAFIMYLFAPRSGAETRRMISQTGENLKNSLGDITGTSNSDMSLHYDDTDEALSASTENTYRPMTYQQQ